MNLDARTDEAHREILGMLPPDLFDLSDLEAGIARLEQMLAATPVDVPPTVTLDDHHAHAADGHQVLVRLYRPADPPPNSAVFLWIHGGGLVLGDVSMDDGQCASIADELRIIVASVDYRLAPAWPYPTPLDDCHTAYRWLLDHAAQLGVDTARVAIGGGSAGGGLAAALAILVRDRAEPAPCFQLLRYPMLDDRNETPSTHAVTDGRVWNRVANVAAWRAYLGSLAGGDDVTPTAAPARATDLGGLPPAIVTVGDLDLFVDEDIAYAQALLRAGVPTELHVYQGAFHGSDQMVAHADLSARWRRDERAALGRALAAT